jgi:hypothetical protein
MLSRRTILAIVGVILCVSVTAVLASDAMEEKQACRADRSAIDYAANGSPVTPSMADPGEYAGTIRVYMVEPFSRWLDYVGEPYRFGFVGFSLNTSFELGPDGMFDTTVIWLPDTSGHANIAADNIAAIATVFDDEPHEAYSDPPSGNPFYAYYVDAAAAAYPGEPGHNETAPGFTHTVFAEQVEVTWCPYCLGSMMKSIYMSGDYPLLYAALVCDEDTVAYEWSMYHYNLVGWPTIYVDGGHGVALGGLVTEPEVRGYIEAAGARPVTPLHLSVAMDWLRQGAIEVHVLVREWLCGDADASGAVDIDDVVYMIAYIFSGGPAPAPLAAGDADCSGGIDIDDVVYLISYIFSGGPAPCDTNGDDMPDC